MPILPAERDPRLITVHRGGTLTDEHHRLLAEWAALCAEHVLPLFEQEQSGDTRPRDAIEIGRAWVRGEVHMRDAHKAALPAGQAVAVAHVAAHATWELRPTRSGQPPLALLPTRQSQHAFGSETGSERESSCGGSRTGLRYQRRRSAICWNAFDD